MSHFDEKDLLTRELRERSQDVGGHPIGLDAVRHTARRIRRRRQVVTGAVAAVVLAMAVPTGLAVTGRLTSGGPVNDPPVADQRAEEPAPGPAGTVTLELAGLSQGDAPGIAYLDGRRLVLADGRTVTLEKTYQEIAPLESGWVGLASDEGSFTRDYIDADGRVTDSLPSTHGLAVSLDGSRVAFSQVENGVMNVFDVTTDGMEPRSPENSEGREVRAVGYAGEGVLVYNSDDGAGNSEARVFEPSAKDYEVPARPRLMGASSASEAAGLVAGMTRSTTDGSCSAVVSYETGEQSFETCKHSLGRFSRDGRYVLGGDAYGDGAGDRGLAVLDAATGEVVVSFEQPRNGQLYLGEPVWEDDEHVLAAVTDGVDTTVVRFGLDGSMETTGVTARSKDYFLPAPIRFAATP